MDGEIISGKFLFLFSLSENYILASFSELVLLPLQVLVMGVRNAVCSGNIRAGPGAASAGNLPQRHKRQLTALLFALWQAHSKAGCAGASLLWADMSPSTVSSGAPCLHAAV